MVRLGSICPREDVRARGSIFRGQGRCPEVSVLLSFADTLKYDASLPLGTDLVFSHA